MTLKLTLATTEEGLLVTTEMIVSGDDRGRGLGHMYKKKFGKKKSSFSERDSVRPYVTVVVSSDIEA